MSTSLKRRVFRPWEDVKFVEIECSATASTSEESLEPLAKRRMIAHRVDDLLSGSGAESPLFIDVIGCDDSDVETSLEDLEGSVSPSSDAFSSSPSPLGPQRRQCVRCSCPNCVARQSGDAQSVADNERVHLCHHEGCGRTYKKTSHLKAHIRYGSLLTYCKNRSCGEVLSIVRT